MEEDNLQIKLTTHNLEDNAGVITFSARLKYLMSPKSTRDGHMLQKASHLAGSSLKLAGGAVKGIGAATGSAVKYLVRESPVLNNIASFLQTALYDLYIIIASTLRFHLCQCN
jgi:hypothetical protein